MEHIHANLLHQYDRELNTSYRGETYVVRDNGAVYRLRRLSSRKRPLDEVWTFGTPSAATGYMQLGSEVVHRIVATAFLGEQPSDKHIVDHIDTNRRNNRPENLRWLTRLENVLLNPVTRRRIEIACGSIEAFLENPSAILNSNAGTNFEWMRTVSKEEAAQALQSFRKWSASEKTPVGGKLGEWIYGAAPSDSVEYCIDLPSPTPNVVQRRWTTPTEFVACPETATEDALAQYAGKLQFGAVFATNMYGESRSVTAELADGSLSVVSNSAKNPIKQWAVAKVTIENGKFVHESVGSYFTLQGALKKHCNLLDIPFEETVDDFA